MTYAELDSWSNRLARVLLAHGAGRDRFVVLALTRSVESIVALWAVAKTGAAFAPLDPNHPPERIEHMIADSRARIGVTTTAIGASLPGTIDWLLLDDLATVRKTMTVSDAPVTDADRGGRRAPPSGCVPDLHLRVHRQAEGGAAGPHRAGEPGAGAMRIPGSRRDVGDPAGRLAEFRRLGVRDCWTAARRARTPGDRRRPTSTAATRWRTCCAPNGSPMPCITPSALATMDPDGSTTCGRSAVAGEAAAPELVARWAPGRAHGEPVRPHARPRIWATGLGEPLVAGETGHHRRPDPWGASTGARHLAASGAGRCAAASCTSPGPGWRAATSAGSG